MIMMAWLTKLVYIQLKNCFIKPSELRPMVHQKRFSFLEEFSATIRNFSPTKWILQDVLMKSDLKAHQATEQTARNYTHPCRIK